MEAGQQGRAAEQRKLDREGANPKGQRAHGSGAGAAQPLHAPLPPQDTATMRASGLLLAAALLLAACLSAEGFATGGLSAAGAARSTAAGVCRGLPLQVCLSRGPLPPATLRASAGAMRIAAVPLHDFMTPSCAAAGRADASRRARFPCADATGCQLRPRAPAGVGACAGGAARWLARRPLPAHPRRVAPLQESRRSHTAVMMSGRGEREKKKKTDVLEMDGYMPPPQQAMRYDLEPVITTRWESEARK